ncbi:hypothetical protein BV25DRAFT_1824153 [Artomyces pyxidatus]|uniref:Uncharacterized protein n=1 Tax=Artomyces pyxidatus TaxID=48021 RepID=A0ACB8T5R3_9AGAM|nr:hypothetical protein BV25DRAFT_1824153 [Artomyces pyxidatus]
MSLSCTVHFLSWFGPCLGAQGAEVILSAVSSDNGRVAILTVLRLWSLSSAILIPHIAGSLSYLLWVCWLSFWLFAPPLSHRVQLQPAVTASAYPHVAPDIYGRNPRFPI